MIRANELRIGNWVKHVSNETWRWVIHLSDFFEEYDSGQAFALMAPIPLTPEILEKAGFESNPYQDRYELAGIHVEYCAVRNELWIEGKPHIKSLHQLQNLFFSLTGEELKIEL